MTTGDRLERWAWWLDRRPTLIVVTLAALYIALVAPSVHRHLWYDELHTFYIAQASSIRLFAEEVRLLDLNPPLSYLLVRASIGVVGPTELGARLPSIIGYFVGSMGLLVFIARRVGPLWGAAGVGLFWYNQFFSLATEARPYGILLGFFGLTMASWDVATTVPSGRRWALAGVAAGATGMLLTHVYAVIWIMPFCIAEVVRYWRTRRTDWPLWAALVLPLAACLTFIPLVQKAAHIVFPPIFEGSAPRLLMFYLAMFLQASPPLAAGSLAAFGVAVWLGSKARMESSLEPATATAMTAEELAFLVAALLPPVVLTAMSVHNHFALYDRHAILTVLTANLMVPLYIARQAHGSRPSGLVAAFVILGFTLLLPGLGLAPQTSRVEASGTTARKDFDRIHPELPLVANSALTYLEMDHYESPELLGRLYYLVDPESSIKYAHSSLTEGLLVMKQYFPIRANVSPYADFAATHRHFLVWGEPEQQQGWLLTKLKAEGAQITELGHFDSPYPDSHLYDVIVNR